MEESDYSLMNVLPHVSNHRRQFCVVYLSESVFSCIIFCPIFVCLLENI